MNYSELKHLNQVESGSRYAADFDYLMHEFCLKKFHDYLVDKRCLELGCYHGHMTKKLSQICKTVTAVDYDHECIDRATLYCGNFNNVDFITFDFMDFSNYAGYEVIYFSHSLEHVPDDKSLLKNISNNLSPGQKLITIVPNGRSLSRQIAVKMGLMADGLEVTEFEKNIGHYRTYDQSLLSNVFIESGFKVLTAGGIMPKIFSNGQFDKCLDNSIISYEFLDALYQLSDKYPEICSSIYVITEKA